MEAAVSQGSRRTELDRNWDNKWYSAVRQSDDYWVVEMAIPFNTLRFNRNTKEWRINFIRNDMHSNVYSTWSRVPVAFGGVDLGYTGLLTWETSPRASKRNIAVIPYTAGQLSHNYNEDERTTRTFVGMDMKVAVTSSLNLDLTVNPDFSNVAVDQQQTNLTQYSLFFPEQRPFFLENGDLFSNYGTWGINPFFSRTIGLHGGESVPIKFGARLSGNLTKKLRIGIMDIQTGQIDDLPSSNFFVGSFQHQVFDRSRLKLLLTNREMISASESATIEEYDRSIGTEFDYLSTDGTLRATAKYHLRDNPGTSDENSYATIGSEYNNGTFFGAFYYNRVGQNYQPDMGFVPSLSYHDALSDSSFNIGFQRINTWIGYIHRPSSGPINNMQFNPWVVARGDLSGRLLQTDAGFWYTVNFKSRQSFEIDLIHSFINTQVPLDFTENADPIPLGYYENYIYRTSWSTDNRKTISGSVSFGYGKFYTGDRIEWRSTLNIRRSPWGNFGVNYTMNKLDLGTQHGETTLHLLGPSATISFSNKLFWSSFLQFNTQSNNFNINSRFQWRFKPMSDFFIVYGENYDTDNLMIQDRSLVAKLTYWFNL
jgi:hypothetical protein